MYTYEYPHAAIAADCCVFGFDGTELKVLLIQRGIDPFMGQWALPGGFLHMDETIEDCAKRELAEEAGIRQVQLSQFKVFSNVNRDPRERVVSIGFLALVPTSEVTGNDDAARAKWFSLDEHPYLAFDHKEILDEARKELSVRISREPIAFKMLKDEFSLNELVRLYELILGKSISYKAFIQKMLDNGIIHQDNYENTISECITHYSFQSMNQMSCLKSLDNSSPYNLQDKTIFRFDEESYWAYKKNQDNYF